MIKRLYYIICDVCMEIHSDSTHGDIKEARTIAAQAGWRRRYYKDICPRCWDAGEPS